MIPPLAVLIPCFNAQAALERTLDSLDAQEAAFDVLVVDDGSTPPLALDPSRYRHRVRVLRLGQNRGIEEALNAGLEAALAGGYRYIARQDAGDRDAPGRLAKQMAYLDAHPGIGFVGAWAQFTDTHGAPSFVFAPPAEPEAVRRRMRYRPAFIHPSLMIRADAFRAAGPYVRGFSRAEDYELCFRLLGRVPGANLPEVLVYKEDDPKSLGNARRRASLLSRLKIQLRYFDPRDVHAWAGLIYTAALFAAPVGALAALKQRLGTVR